jgi:hypothetical protein
LEAYAAACEDQAGFMLSSSFQGLPAAAVHFGPDAYDDVLAESGRSSPVGSPSPATPFSSSSHKGRASTQPIGMTAWISQQQDQQQLDSRQVLSEPSSATGRSHAAAIAQLLSKDSKRRVRWAGLRGLELQPNCLPGEGSGSIRQVVLGKGALSGTETAGMMQHLGKVSVIGLDCEGSEKQMAVVAIMAPAAGKLLYNRLCMPLKCFLATAPYCKQPQHCFSCAPP